MRRVVWGWIVVTLALAASAAGEPQRESPEAVLDAAFANRY